MPKKPDNLTKVMKKVKSDGEEEEKEIPVTKEMLKWEKFEEMERFIKSLETNMKSWEKHHLTRV